MYEQFLILPNFDEESCFIASRKSLEGYTGSQRHRGSSYAGIKDCYSVVRELSQYGYRPFWNVIGVLLEGLAVGHAEQQTGLGVVHGVVVDVHTAGNHDEYGLMILLYHAASIFCASLFSWLKNCAVASALFLAASSAASRISCDRISSVGSSILVSL